MEPWTTSHLRPDYDVLAPDGSEIRELVAVQGGSMVHCTLRPGAVTQAVQHRTVEEVWFCLAGRGQVWRAQADHAELTELTPGTAINLPLGTAFEFRTLGDEPLAVLITTVPPWPGPDEAFPVDGHWPPRQPADG